MLVFSREMLLAQNVESLDWLPRWLAEVIVFLIHLYDGLPYGVIPLFWVALSIVLLSTLSLLVLTNRAQDELRHERRLRQSDHAPDEHEADYLWVFMVPALNEETVITDSVTRLSEVRVTHKRVLVINDGSDDDTGGVLSQLEFRELTVLTRVAPNARQGKSEALNDAWRYLHRTVLGEGQYRGWDPNKVIVAIVDADGRLDPEAGRVTRHFENELVGGVQSLVRIYNKKSFLTLAQDLEFSIFGIVFQLGRMGWGTANMGGNGQFNRLAALDSIAVEDDEGRIGPWRAGRLTEDQDIGLRLIHEGWRGSQSQEVTIDQQGLHSLRQLYRQRTRWAQGGWQVLALIWSSIRNPRIGFIAKCDQLWYLITPLVQALMGVSVVLSVAFLVFEVVEPEWTLFVIVLLYMFSVFPGVVGVLFARRSRKITQFLANILIAHLYVVYSWLVYPVVYRALLRMIFRRQSWAKTNRESVHQDDAEQTDLETLLGRHDSLDP